MWKSLENVENIMKNVESCTLIMLFLIFFRISIFSIYDIYDCGLNNYSDVWLWTRKQVKIDAEWVDFSE